MRWTIVVMVLLCACQEEAAPGSAAEDAGLLPDVEAPPLPDAMLLPDAAPLRGFGEPCAQNAECASGWCVESAQFGRICTRTCGDCPEGFECSHVANAGPDRVFLCLADQPDLCKPCRNDRECDDNEDLCLDFGRSRYCGEDCATDGYCPDGYECTDVLDGETVVARQCRPAGGEGCQPCLDRDGDGYGDGADCLGFDCDDADPTVHQGATEICDDKDNDCNALVDDAARGAPPADCLSRGVCAGTRLACVAGTWACAFPATYEADVETRCDGLDNDCDGAIDEQLLGTPLHCGHCGQVCAFPHAEGLCVDGACELGDCEAGWHDVDDNAGNGCEYACNPTRGGVEACDDIDNDCDGRTDEDFDLQRDAAHCGACGTTCAFANAEARCERGRCERGPCTPGFHDADGDPANGCELPCEPVGDETCNGRDDDCDGRTDEGFDLQTSLTHCGACDQPCAIARGTGECVGGRCVFVQCDDGFHDANGQLQDGCEYACTPTLGGLEACDRIDNDCDGRTDEDFAGRAEVCNGADDDCDGTADEGFDLASDPLHCGACGRLCVTPNAMPRCAAGQCGVRECLPGFFDIDGLAETGCEYACHPQNAGLELCNDIDDDCDGRADEGYDLQGDPENCGACGRRCEQLNAVTTCQGGQCSFVRCDPGFHDIDGQPGCEYACQPQGAEACNRADDDCDGRIDEGVLNRCGGCGPEPAEVCNGLDDDCDGATDEGVQNRCGGCGPEPAEVCDGVDNDCNGITDDHGVCGPYVQSQCRLYAGWADNNRGPLSPSDSWAGCPGVDRTVAGEVRCAGTRGDGRFALINYGGDVDHNDQIALMFRCDDPGNPALAAWIQSRCAAFFGHADNAQGPDGVDRWGPCPADIRGDDGRLRCTSSGFDGRFWRTNLSGDVDGNDDFAVAWICRDAADPARALALQQSVEVFLGLADVRSQVDGTATWATCPGNSFGYTPRQGCVGSQGDGRFHRLHFGPIGGDVDDNDQIGWAIRARPAP